MLWGRGLSGFLFAMVAAAAASAAPPEPEHGNRERGKTVFEACNGCHQVGAGARHGIGPHLDALFGRRAGSLDGFRYSSAMRRRGKDGLVWDAATLDRYLQKPRRMVPGTRMSFRGLSDKRAREDLIAYLKAATASAPASNPSAPSPPRPEIGGAAMAIEGDAAYGEYLAGECVTCHQRSGRTDGIPSIVGWPREAFIRALFEYKSNVRRHQVMSMMTANLGNEEIAALAAFFSGLDPQ
ncbi:cytochrome c [Breoghania corrubedonensis]|uniref:Cytochrome c n=1 Tax=Breoghania corrubedonensis TaxID=665038 RepID=A0A2T5VHW4_9HYPH|nr:c-type cytochrome [Breoghania corrubedonensis]PTW63357.1 cytochrome c [Breoghania corrubedonensis]